MCLRTVLIIVLNAWHSAFLVSLHNLRALPTPVSPSVPQLYRRDGRSKLVVGSVLWLLYGTSSNLAQARGCMALSLLRMTSYTLPIVQKLDPNRRQIVTS